MKNSKKLGAKPFIVPAMGSHGGATSQGQVDVLAGLGVTEESAGYPILSSLEVVELDVLDNDRMAIQAAIKTCNVYDQGKIRMVRIANSLNIGEIYISESMLGEAQNHQDITVLGELAALTFDGDGNLTDIGAWL